MGSRAIDRPGDLLRRFGLRWNPAAWSLRTNRSQRAPPRASAGARRRVERRGCRWNPGGSKEDRVPRRSHRSPGVPGAYRLRARHSNRKATTTGPCWNIRKRSRYVEAKRRGSFGPADSALAHRRMAGALDRLGRFAQAEVHYQKALKLSPRDPKVWNDAGYSYYLQGRWPDAERALKTAAKLAPDDERIRINLGLALAAAGKTDEAFPLLSQSTGDANGACQPGVPSGRHRSIRPGATAVRNGPCAAARHGAGTTSARPARPSAAKPRHAKPVGRAPGRKGCASPRIPVDPEVKPAGATSTKIPPPVTWRNPPGT